MRQGLRGSAEMSFCLVLSPCLPINGLSATPSPVPWCPGHCSASPSPHRNHWGTPPPGTKRRRVKFMCPRVSWGRAWQCCPSVGRPPHEHSSSESLLPPPDTGTESLWRGWDLSAMGWTANPWEGEIPGLILLPPADSLQEGLPDHQWDMYRCQVTRRGPQASVRVNCHPESTLCWEPQKKENMFVVYYF